MTGTNCGSLLASYVSGNSFFVYLLKDAESLCLNANSWLSPGFMIHNTMSEQYPLPEMIRNHLDPAIDSSNLGEFKEAKRKVSVLMLGEEKTHDENKCLQFLENLLNQVYKMYKSPIECDSNEDAFNQLYTWPYLDLVGNSINTGECQGYFIQGQPILMSMMQQLKESGVIVDEKSQYKSDGIIKILNLKDLEILILETSGHFTNTDTVKINLDHRKAVYGMLAMHFSIADEYSFASVVQFSQIRIFFLHATEKKLHLWSMRFDVGGFFDLWRESALKIKTCFQDRILFLPQLVKFFWNAKRLLEQAVKNIVDVKNEHLKNVIQFLYNPEEYSQLSDIINPVILKLTKEEDSLSMGKLGPIYSPFHH